LPFLGIAIEEIIGLCPLRNDPHPEGWKVAIGGIITEVFRLQILDVGPVEPDSHEGPLF